LWVARETTPAAPAPRSPIWNKVKISSTVQEMLEEKTVLVPRQLLHI